MSTQNFNYTAVVNLFPEGHLEWWNAKGEPQGRAGKISTGDALASTFGFIATIAAAAECTPVAVVAGLGSATAQVIEKIVAKDEEEQDTNWRHEIALYRVWAYRPPGSTTYYDSTYNSALKSSATEHDEDSATMVRDSAPMKVGAFYFLRGNLNVSVTGRTTYDNTWFKAAAKWSNGSSLFAKVDIDC
ncbi:MAG: hypothetical protein GVY16_08015 [Planctomycetes bacterium]|nr:hypothetical protein [Planctomycetota bacterium]